MTMSKKNTKSQEELLKEALVPVEEQPYELPGNWVWVKLGKVIDVNPPKRKMIDIKDNDIFSFIPMAAVSDIEGVIFAPEEREFKKVKTGYTQFVDGDVIFAKITPCMENGKSAIVRELINGIGYGSTEFYVLRTKGMIDNRFLYQLVRSSSFRAEAKRHMSGAVGQQRVPKKFIEDYPFPLPPLYEQKRIADKVERFLGKINKAKQLIEEAKANFELRRVAILDQAFRGELTKKWREENFIKLDLLAEEDNAYFELPGSWKWVKAEYLFVEFPRNGYSPKSTDSSSITKTLKLGAITKGYYKDDEFKYIDENIEPNSYLWLKNGDFLIQRANSIEYVGTSAIFTGEDNECIYPDLIMKGKVNESIVLNQYLVHWINSMYGKQYFKKNATGTAGNMPKINKSILQNLLVPIPPLEEQRVIMGIIDSVFYKDNDALNNLDKFQPAIELLINGILKKAYSGKLGTTQVEEEAIVDLLKTL